MGDNHARMIKVCLDCLENDDDSGYALDIKRKTCDRCGKTIVGQWSVVRESAQDHVAKKHGPASDAMVSEVRGILERLGSGDRPHEWEPWYDEWFAGVIKIQDVMWSLVERIEKDVNATD